MREIVFLLCLCMHLLGCDQDSGLPFTTPPHGADDGTDRDAAALTDLPADPTLDAPLMIDLSPDPSPDLIGRPGLALSFDPLSMNVGRAGQSMWTGDVDGDGFPDAIIGSGSSVDVYLTDPRPAPSPVIGLANVENVAGGVMGLVVRDVNKDRKLDVVVVGSDAQSGISVLLGDGGGRFKINSHIATMFDPRALAAEDFDGDGNVDLAVTNHNHGVGWVDAFRGDGSGGFTALATYRCGQDPVAIVAADLNNDKLFDLIVADRVDGQVITLLGMPLADFTPAVYLRVTGYPASLVAGFFRGPPNRDVALGMYLGNSVGFLRSDGKGTLTQTSISGAGDTPVGIVTADFDKDGKLDVAVAHWLGGSVGILLGEGDGTFLPMREIRIGASPLALAVADLDQDGRPDIMTSNQQLSLTVLHNTSK